MKFLLLIISITTLLNYSQTRLCDEFSIPKLSNTTDETLKIGSFNIQNFGQTKYRRTHVVQRILKIMERYDILIVLEFVGPIAVPYAVLDDLNRHVQDLNTSYAMLISRALGRSRQTERVGLFYRKKFNVKVLGVDYYPNLNDTYERPPYMVKLGLSNSNTIQNMTLVGLHLKPRDADIEALALANVHQYLTTESKLRESPNQPHNIAYMGDWNAGCSRYIKYTKWKNIKVAHYNNMKMVHLIPDDKDTTVFASKCAHDRIGLVGEDFFESVLHHQAYVYNFTKELNLSFKDAKNISDHLPVEFTLSRHVTCEEDLLIGK
ncbi:hypothetical protein SNEBB_010398 [Seison nebaliae]|nr:hypothetical protein SNEBB_010398 [Seison nebaliae]